MPITTSCPGCKALFRLPEELAGRNVRCQKCARMFLVPGVGSEAVPALEAVAPEPEAVPEPTPAPVQETAQPEAPPIVVTPRLEPTPAAKPAPARPPSRFWLPALIVAFVLAMLLTGTVASIWVGTHLAPPSRAMIVPPFRGNNVQHEHHHFNDGRQPRDFRNNFERDNPPKMFKDDLQKQEVLTPIKLKPPPPGQKTNRLDQLTFPGLEFDAGNFRRNGPFRLYRVLVDNGQTLNIHVISDTFDPHVEIFREFDLKPILRRSAQPNKRRVMASVKAELATEYRIWVYSSEHVQDAFTLVIALEQKLPPARIQPTADEKPHFHALSEVLPLDPAEPQAGPYREYVVRLETGKEYQFKVSSPLFAPTLRFYHGNTTDVIHAEANETEHKHTARFTGDHRIRVTSQNHGVGAYTFSVTRK